MNKLNIGDHVNYIGDEMTLKGKKDIIKYNPYKIMHHSKDIDCYCIQSLVDKSKVFNVGKEELHFIEKGNILD